MSIKISECKCEDCKAEFEALKSDKKIECPGCNGKNVKETLVKELQMGCGGGCAGCGEGCN